jgi:hypothetical protein
MKSESYTYVCATQIEMGMGKAKHLPEAYLQAIMDSFPS